MMRVLYILFVSCVVAVLTACEPVGENLPLYNGNVIADSPITNSEGKEANLGSVKAGTEEPVVCTTADSVAIALPTGVEGDRWTNESDSAVGFIPATVIEAPSETPPSCEDYLHGPEEHKAHTAPTS